MFGPLKTVAVYVDDQQQATDFYVSKLGFEIRRKMSNKDAIRRRQNGNPGFIVPPRGRSNLGLWTSHNAGFMHQRLELIYGILEVDLTDGRTLVQEADERYRGEPDYPFTREDLYEKFT